MKLPTQSRPVIRNTSSIKILDAQMSGITASECNRAGCGTALAACHAILVGGPLAIAPYWGCMVQAKFNACRGCDEGWDQCVDRVRGRYGQCIGDSVTSGAYKFDGPAIYYADGKGAYCQYDTVENFLRLNHGGKHTTWPGRSPSILGYRNDGVCR
jgi:hypothetical protein